MQVPTKLLPATFTLNFVLATFVSMLHRILYILNAVNLHFSAAPTYMMGSRKVL